MKPVRALVLSGYGINCEREMAKGAFLAGAETVILHAKAWLIGEVDLSAFDLLIFPGGFSFGDELGAAKAFANRISFSKKSDDLFRFIDQGKCILGVCNGFQLLVKLGILPGSNKRQEASLIRNEKGKFESRWVYHKVTETRCVFTSGLNNLYLPVRHGEGNFTMPDLKLLFEKGQVVLQYATPSLKTTLDYPSNPNGSLDSIAGISDETGRVLGMMAHPEAALFFTQMPHWTREKRDLQKCKKPIPEEGPGLALFKNAVNYLRNQ